MAEESINTSLTLEIVLLNGGNLSDSRSSSMGKPSALNGGQNKYPDNHQASSGSYHCGGNSRKQSMGKPTLPNSGQDILPQPRHIRASTGSLPDVINGKAISQNSGESVTPHYLRASTGSCHDFCKYGRKHATEVKERCPIPKRIVTPQSDQQNLTESRASAERKTAKVVELKPSPVSKTLSPDSSNSLKQKVSSPSKMVVVSSRQASPNEKHIAQNEKRKISPQKRALVKPKTLTVKPLSSPETSGGSKIVEVSSRRASPSEKLIAQNERKKISPRKHAPPVKPKTLTVKPLSSPETSGGSKKVEVSSRLASPNENQIAQSEKQKISPQKHAPPVKPKTLTVKPLSSPGTSGGSKKVEVSSRLASPNEKQMAQNEKKKIYPRKTAPPVKPKTLAVKSLSSPDNSGGMKGRKNSENKISKKIGSSKAAMKKVLASPAASLSPRPSISRPVSFSVKKYRSLKLLSPLKDQNRIRKAEPKKSNHEKVPEKILHVITVETENKVVKSTQIGSTLCSPPSPPKFSSLPKSPSLSFREDEVQEESEYTNSEADESYDSISESSETVKLHEVETSDKNPIGGPRKVRIGFSEDKDCMATKLKFRRGKVVDLQPENSGPRRLRFRRGRVLGENQNGKADVRRRSFKKREVDGDNGTDANSGKVFLRHQEVEGKKDAQGLFNNVIEETASKLVETRKSKVKALVGAFETVISLQESKPSIQTLS